MLLLLFFKEEEFFSNLNKLEDCTSTHRIYVPLEEEEYLVFSVWNWVKATPFGLTWKTSNNSEVPLSPLPPSISPSMTDTNILFCTFAITLCFPIEAIEHLTLHNSFHLCKHSPDVSHSPGSCSPDNELWIFPPYQGHDNEEGSSGLLNSPPRAVLWQGEKKDS